MWSSKVLTLSLGLGLSMRLNMGPSMGLSMRLSMILSVSARGSILWRSLCRTELAFWHLTCDRRCGRRCNWLRSPLLTDRRGSYLGARSDDRLGLLRLRWIWKPGI